MRGHPFLRRRKDLVDMLIPPRRIALSGGGVRAIAHLGALSHLEKKGMLKAVREYIGVSAGAFVGFTLMLGYTLSELKTLCSLFDFSLVRKLDPEAALEFPVTFGLDNGENLVKLLHSLLRIKKQSTTLTFGEWKTKYPTAIELRCFATDLFTTKPREFSAAKTPNICIVDALRASMALPVYFTPVKDPETGHMLVDGGILHNSPLAFLPHHERSSAIGISFSYDFTKVDAIDDILTFFSQIFACYYIPRTNHVHEQNRGNCILIPCGNVPAWNFEASREEREEIIDLGEKAAELFCNTHSNNTVEQLPIRRYSVS